MESQRERSSALACWPRGMPGTGAVAGGVQDGGVHLAMPERRQWNTALLVHGASMRHT
jgi:hypothetical protein